MSFYPLERVISGGQTGIDQLGLEVARSLGIPTGGTAPKGYMTEDGPNQQLCDYGLIEHSSAKYPPRTRANVQQSDGTVLFGNLIGGTRQTLDFCVQERKPCCVNPNADQLRDWLVEYKIRTLNVAGNRVSGLSGEQLQQYRHVLTNALQQYAGSGR